MNQNDKPKIDPNNPEHPDPKPGPNNPDIPRKMPEAPDAPNKVPVEVPHTGPEEVAIKEPEKPERPPRETLSICEENITKY